MLACAYIYSSQAMLCLGIFPTPCGGSTQLGSRTAPRPLSHAPSLKGKGEKIQQNGRFRTPKKQVTFFLTSKKEDKTASLRPLGLPCPSLGPPWGFRDSRGALFAFW